MYDATVTEGADRVFSALGDGTRRRICEILSTDGERTVTELVGHFPISQPAVSRHLRVLRDAGLVRVRPRGRTRCYRLHRAAFDPAGGWLVLNGFWTERLDALSHLLDTEGTP